MHGPRNRLAWGETHRTQIDPSENVFEVTFVVPSAKDPYHALVAVVEVVVDDQKPPCIVASVIKFAFARDAKPCS